jgi:hypothetical protein
MADMRLGLNAIIRDLFILLTTLVFVTWKEDVTVCRVKQGHFFYAAADKAIVTKLGTNIH